MKTTLPKIRLGKITLREICELDYLDYYDIGRNEDVCKYLNWGPFLRINDAKFIIDEIFMHRPDEGLPKGYAIVLDNKMIGEIDFHNYRIEANSAEIGFILHHDYHNQGIMTKCLKAMIRVGFYDMDLDKIIVGHAYDNIASQRVIEKCGFKYECDKIENLKDNDVLARYYSIYRHEYKEDYLW